MNKITAFALAAVMAIGISVPARAQYYEIANQLPGLLSPALSGSLQYRGFVEASGLAGIGRNRANFLGVSTTQGFQYASWFYMGVGAGVDVAMASRDSDRFDPMAPGEWNPRGTAKTKVMIPVFSDFRFRIGSDKTVSAFLDLKLGAAWFLGSDYLYMNTAYMTNQTQFYFRPSIGVRIPTDKEKPRQAVCVALTYQLLTSNNNYNYYYDHSVTLSNLGLTVGYEW